MEKSLTSSKQNDNTLAEIFDARSVAVVGASLDPGKSGHQILKSLLDHGFRGQIFAINPKEREILGVACHSSILDVPSPIDLLVITVPAPQVLTVMSQAVQRGDVKGAVVVSAGFAETAVPEWVEAESQVGADGQVVRNPRHRPELQWHYQLRELTSTRVLLRGSPLTVERSATSRRVGQQAAPC